MNVIYIATGIVSVLGIVLAAITAGRFLHIPAPLGPADDIWPYDAIDYLWWDEGIYWAAR